jgi:hypothetical protein
MNLRDRWRPLVIRFDSWFAEEGGGRDTKDTGDAMQEGDRRCLQSALDLRQVVVGDPGQPGHHRLLLALRFAVEPDSFTDWDLGC